MTEKNRGGRPRQGPEVKRAPLNMRTSPAMRTQLEEAADARGWSLTQEVEARLQRTFDEDSYRGGSHNGAFFHLAVASARSIEERNGGRWDEDIETFWAVKAAVNSLLEVNRPLLTPEIIEAQADVDAALKKIEDEVPQRKGSYVGRLLAMKPGASVATAARSASKDDPDAERIADAIDLQFEDVRAALARLDTLVPTGEQKRAQEAAGGEIAGEHFLRFSGKKLRR
ncbi:hypothetical protein [Glacieibacterium sp.]|uniref:hypothetical protein n=1 Tax=Glacieibacterium sp. TaxID=2860237 RepID=UPI003B00EFA1